MASPSREAIETFISFTGAAESIAVQKLQAYGADLDAAVNAYFNERDRSSSMNAHPTSDSGGCDFMGIDDLFDVERRGSPRSPLSTAREIMDPFSILDLNLRPGLFGYASGFTNLAPIVTHPRDLREALIEFRDGSRPSGQLKHVPKIEDVTGTVDDHGPEVRGTVVIDDGKEDEEPPVASIAYAPELEHPRIASNISRGRNDVYGAFESGGFQDTDDIEEEMIRAAIEASKKDVMQAYPSDTLTSHTELGRHLAEIEASLPSEPRSDDENAVTLLVRMPDGSRLSRRFLRSDKLQRLFDFIDMGRVVKPGSYRLVRPYPGKAFGDEERSSTLNELELNSKQETLNVELI